MALAHHQVYSRFIEQRTPGNGTGHRLPAKVAKDIAKREAVQDAQAGRPACYCETCSRKYGMSYMVLVYQGMFRTEVYVCRDCQEQHKYTRV